MNNKFHPWAAPLQAPLPSQKLLPSQDDGTDNIMTWEEYQAIKMATADEERKLKKRVWNRKKYDDMMSNEEEYRKHTIRNRKYQRKWRAAKKEKESIQKKKKEDAVETLLSIAKGGSVA